MLLPGKMRELSNRAQWKEWNVAVIYKGEFISNFIPEQSNWRAILDSTDAFMTGW